MRLEEYRVPVQALSNWCWIAVAKSLGEYHRASKFKHQCELAKSVLLDDEACGLDPHAPYNSVGYLEDALMVARCQSRPYDGPLSEVDLNWFLSRQWPVAALIQWQQGGQHYVVIAGQWSDGERESQLRIADPHGLDGTWPYTKFANSYRGEGTWIQTIACWPRGQA